MSYGQYLLSNKVQWQHHEFFEQHHNVNQPATHYVEFRYQFCTGLSYPKPEHEFIVFLGEYYHTFVEIVSALYQHTLFHGTLTCRIPFPVRKPFYRTEQSNSA